MRHIDCTGFLCGPEFDAWLRRARRARESALQTVANGQLIRWKNEIWKDLKENFLIEGNYGKCMYCEGRYVAGSYDDAEHYCPRGGVTINRERIEHPGFYWLAYEWQNILLACEKCNRPHPDGEGGPHPGKLNEFPMRGECVRQPGADPQTWWEELLAEEPLLLHPYFDEPEKHFRAAKHGVIYGITERGRATIKICDLNRPKLCVERLFAEECHLQGRPVTMKFRIERDKSIDDLLFEARYPFSVYLNSRLIDYALKLMEA